jgi:hypothetical protein
MLHKCHRSESRVEHHVRFVSRGRFDALVIAAAFTIAFGVLSHLIVEAVVNGPRLELATPAHGLMAGGSILALVWSFARIGGSRSATERRRRTALVRSALRIDRPAFFLALACAQATIAAGILRGEEIVIAPQHMLAALVSGALAVLAGSLALRLARRPICTILSSWAALREPTLPCQTCARTRFAPRRSMEIPLLRSYPDRAPPVLLIA